MVPRKWIAAGFAGLVFLILIAIVWGSYNGLISSDQEIKSQWGKVESAYQRRIDLIPNLVSTVQSYAQFEKDTLTQVTELRSQWQAASTLEKRVETTNQLESALSKLLLISENYPDLKANQNFLALQDELAGTENRIKVERDRFNDAVAKYNILTKGFPSNIIAGWFGFKEVSYFKATTPGAEVAPKVAIEVK